MRYLIPLFIAFVFVGCSLKQPIYSKSATVIFKTPNMKFYDKGFVTKYSDHIHLEVFSVGQLVLNLKIYKDQVCKSTFKCTNAKEFNKNFLHPSYESNFMYDLFSKEKIYHKDKKHKILIKIK